MLIYGLTILTIFFILASFLIRRSIPFLWMSLVVVSSYHVDAIFTLQHGSLYFSQSIDSASFSIHSMIIVLLQATACIGLLSIFNIFLGKKTNLSRSGGLNIDKNIFSAAVIWLLLVIALTFFVFDVSDVAQILINRQVFFEDNVLALIVLYVLPAVAILFFINYFHTSSSRIKWFSFLALLLLVFLGTLTGSRSTLMLSILLPAVMYIYLVKLNKKGYQAIPLKGLAAVGLLLMAFVYLAITYRDMTRGDQEDINLFISADSISLDSSIIIVERNLGRKGTYFSALTFLVPRSVWPDKPESGNNYLTEELFPVRFSNGGLAEITTSLLGESYINFGDFGFVFASFLLCVLVWISDKFLSKGGLFFILGILFYCRGTNLVRGDLLNTVVPLFFSYLVIISATIKYRFRKGE